MIPALVLDELKKNGCHKLVVGVVEYVLNMADVLLCYKVQWHSLVGGFIDDSLCSVKVTTAGRTAVVP